MQIDMHHKIGVLALYIRLLQINGCVMQRFPAVLVDLLNCLLVLNSDDSIKGSVQTLKVST